MLPAFRPLLYAGRVDWTPSSEVRIAHRSVSHFADVEEFSGEFSLNFIAYDSLFIFPGENITIVSFNLCSLVLLPSVHPHFPPSGYHLCFVWGKPRFRSRVVTGYPDKVFVVSLWTLQTNTGIMPSIMLWPLPSQSCLIYQLIFLFFGTMFSEHTVQCH